MEGLHGAKSLPPIDILGGAFFTTISTSRMLAIMCSMTDMNLLPHAEFMTPGPDRDRLNRLILDGRKTATTVLLAEYEACGEPLPQPGDRSVLVDSQEWPIAVLVTTDVQIEALNNVSFQHVLDEGEGQSSVAQWREEHEAFWNSISSDLGGIRIDDDTKVVLEHFTVER